MTEEKKIWYPPEDKVVEPPKPTTILREESGDSFAYLLVRNRIAWFRRFCAAHNIFGSIQTERCDRKPEPDGGYSENFKATILMNGEIVATGFGSAKSIELGPGIKVLETAETAAIGRALSCAGFNLEIESPDAGDGDGMRSFADAPMPFAPYVPPAGWVQPPVQQPNGYQPPIQPTAQQNTPQAQSTASLQPMPANLDEAMAVLCPPGKYQGKTLGEVNGSDEWYISFLAGRANMEFRSASRYPAVVAAAQMICDMGA